MRSITVEWLMDYSNFRAVLDSDSNQVGHIVHVPIDEVFGTIDGVDPDSDIAELHIVVKSASLVNIK